MPYESNLKNVNKALKKWESNALEAIGFFVERAAKDLAPYDTGNLENSINFKVDEGKKAVRVGTNVEYAIFQEKGTVKMQGQPFLTPAVEDNVNKIKQVIKAVRFGGIG